MPVGMSLLSLQKLVPPPDSSSSSSPQQQQQRRPLSARGPKEEHQRNSTPPLSPRAMSKGGTSGNAPQFMQKLSRPSEDEWREREQRIEQARTKKLEKLSRRAITIQMAELKKQKKAVDQRHSLDLSREEAVKSRHLSGQEKFQAAEKRRSIQFNMRFSEIQERNRELEKKIKEIERWKKAERESQPGQEIDLSDDSDEFRDECASPDAPDTKEGPDDITDRENQLLEAENRREQQLKKRLQQIHERNKQIDEKSKEIRRRKQESEETSGPSPEPLENPEMQRIVAAAQRREERQRVRLDKIKSTNRHLDEKIGRILEWKRETDVHPNRMPGQNSPHISGGDSSSDDDEVVAKENEDEGNSENGGESPSTINISVISPTQKCRLEFTADPRVATTTTTTESSHYSARRSPTRKPDIPPSSPNDQKTRRPVSPLLRQLLEDECIRIRVENLRCASSTQRGRLSDSTDIFLQLLLDFEADSLHSTQNASPQPSRAQSPSNSATRKRWQISPIRLFYSDEVLDPRKRTPKTMFFNAGSGDTPEESGEIPDQQSGFFFI